MPSTVVTSCPSTACASTRQERTGTPSTSTVQAPHSPSSQPCLVPVSCEILAQQLQQRGVWLVERLTRFAVDAEGAPDAGNAIPKLNQFTVTHDTPRVDVPPLRVPERGTGGEVGRYSGLSFASTSSTTAAGTRPAISAFRAFQSVLRR